MRAVSDLNVSQVIREQQPFFGKIVLRGEQGLQCNPIQSDNSSLTKVVQEHWLLTW